MPIATRLRALIQQKADVNAAEADGTTALHWASYRDDAESADLLIRAGAKVNAANDLGATPLWTASMNGSAAMVAAAARMPARIPTWRCCRRDAADGRVAIGQCRRRRAAARERRRRQRSRATRADRADVGGVAAASRGREGAARARRRCPARADAWSQVMAVPPHGLPEYNRIIPHGRDTALMFAARVGDLESAKLLVARRGERQ